MFWKFVQFLRFLNKCIFVSYQVSSVSCLSLWFNVVLCNAVKCISLTGSLFIHFYFIKDAAASILSTSESGAELFVGLKTVKTRILKIPHIFTIRHSRGSCLFPEVTYISDPVKPGAV